jgi:ring-1,2-phenylacetyl-CoA epoxidase subunit PaaA
MDVQERTSDGKLAEFEARIARGEKIEPGDWMPDEYRKQLIRMIGQHAHSEIVGMLPEGKWIPYAPGFRRKLTLIAKVQDEAGHGQLLYRAAETLGKSREEMLEELLEGKAKYSNVFNYPTPTWADVGIIGWLVDGAAVVNQRMIAKSSYGPYARAMKRICFEESFHIKQGQDLLIRMVFGTGDQQQMAQDALNRWWYPTLMMLGMPDSDSPHLAKLKRWGVKVKTNDELRQEFVDLVVPQLQSVGLKIPDDNLYYDEKTGHWHFSQPDYEELKRVIRGDGPLNKERLEARRKAHEEGRWVREALAVANRKRGVPSV